MPRVLTVNSPDAHTGPAVATLEGWCEERRKTRGGPAEAEAGAETSDGGGGGDPTRSSRESRGCPPSPDAAGRDRWTRLDALERLAGARRAVQEYVPARVASFTIRQAAVNEYDPKDVRTLASTLLQPADTPPPAFRPPRLPLALDSKLPPKSFRYGPLSLVPMLVAAETAAEKKRRRGAPRPESPTRAAAAGEAAGGGDGGGPMWTGVDIVTQRGNLNKVALDDQWWAVGAQKIGGVLFLRRYVKRSGVDVNVIGSQASPPKGSRLQLVPPGHRRQDRPAPDIARVGGRRRLRRAPGPAAFVEPTIVHTLPAVPGGRPVPDPGRSAVGGGTQMRREEAEGCGAQEALAAVAPLRGRPHRLRLPLLRRLRRRRRHGRRLSRRHRRRGGGEGRAFREDRAGARVPRRERPGRRPNVRVQEGESRGPAGRAEREGRPRQGSPENLRRARVRLRGDARRRAGGLQERGRVAFVSGSSRPFILFRRGEIGPQTRIQLRAVPNHLPLGSSLAPEANYRVGLCGRRPARGAALAERPPRPFASAPGTLLAEDDAPARAALSLGPAAPLAHAAEGVLHDGQRAADARLVVVDDADGLLAGGAGGQVEVHRPLVGGQGGQRPRQRSERGNFARPRQRAGLADPVTGAEPRSPGVGDHVPEFPTGAGLAAYSVFLTAAAAAAVAVVVGAGVALLLLLLLLLLLHRVPLNNVVSVPRRLVGSPRAADPERFELELLEFHAGLPAAGGRPAADHFGLAVVRPVLPRREPPPLLVEHQDQGGHRQAHDVDPRAAPGAEVLQAGQPRQHQGQYVVGHERGIDDDRPDRRRENELLERHRHRQGRAPGGPGQQRILGGVPRPPSSRRVFSFLSVERPVRALRRAGPPLAIALPSRIFRPPLVLRAACRPARVRQRKESLQAGIDQSGQSREIAPVPVLHGRMERRVHVTARRRERKQRPHVQMSENLWGKAR
ncbi:MAG: hypothetical protein BJ554DRAFT_432 [Olpidium bornovanus]|uniref:Uncharacterized protein n=1 Tax=Olpidium bornovanus TaxID=278681 RepID=A0A8H7ZTK8_9FUNG|nr:MAG: hypothetical protein BJ554DRAFT_432 [Olpidium bornovanus]